MVRAYLNLIWFNLGAFSYSLGHGDLGDISVGYVFKGALSREHVLGGEEVKVMGASPLLALPDLPEWLNLPDPP